MPRKLPTMPSGSSAITVPVNMSAQVDALTMDELDWPRCLPQLAGEILSWISASTV